MGRILRKISFVLPYFLNRTYLIHFQCCFQVPPELRLITGDIMVKMHKLTKGGQTIFPATIYDAVVNPNTRKSLTTELSELENEEIYLKTQIEGSIDKDLITENTVWIDGTWDWETNSSAGNSIQKQIDRCRILRYSKNVRTIRKSRRF